MYLRTVRNAIYSGWFQEPIGKLVLNNNRVRLLVRTYAKHPYLLVRRGSAMAVPTPCLPQSVWVGKRRRSRSGACHICKHTFFLFPIPYSHICYSHIYRSAVPCSQIRRSEVPFIQQIIAEYAQIPYARGEIERHSIFDRDRDLLIIVGWEGVRQVHGCIIHMEIIDGKIWIHRDGTEDRVAAELLQAGIPKERIVLGFKSPGVRKYTELAVA